MGKYITGVVMLILATFVYRTADIYFTERRLRHAVWQSMDPAVRDDAAIKELIVDRVGRLSVEINPDDISFTNEEKAEPEGSIGGVVQVFKRTKSVSFSYTYRKMGAVKKGVLNVRRESVSKGVAGTP
jgi:hypothetical protein